MYVCTKKLRTPMIIFICICNYVYVILNSATRQSTYYEDLIRETTF